MERLEVTIRKLFYLRQMEVIHLSIVRRGIGADATAVFIHFRSPCFWPHLNFQPHPHPNLHQSCPYVTTCLLPNMLSDLQSITKGKKEEKREGKLLQRYITCRSYYYDFYYCILRRLNPSVIMPFPWVTRPSNSLPIAPQVSSCIIFE
jgi:hypothetical protein